MEDITLKTLIEEFRNRIPNLRTVKGYFTYYKYDDMEEYEKWLAKTRRFLHIHYPNDQSVLEFEEISNERLNREQQQKMLAILEALSCFPTIINQKDNTDKDKKGNIDSDKNKNGAITVNINNTNSQSQNQEQSLAIDIFLEAIREDLTGKQIKELKEVLATSGNDEEKARSGIIEKLKSFGSDVAANIVANILTNPIIGGGL